MINAAALIPETFHRKTGAVDSPFWLLIELNRGLADNRELRLIVKTCYALPGVDRSTVYRYIRKMEKSHDD